MSKQSPKVVDLPLSARNGRSCPLCGKPVERRYRPFCSKRCADLDLGNWLNDSYVVAGAEDDSEGLAEEDNEA